MIYLMLQVILQGHYMIKSEDKLYNTIAYISLLIWYLFVILIIINQFVYSFIIDENYKSVLIIVGTGFAMIYYKIHTIPITEAINNYWKYKIKKQGKNEESENLDYKSWKKK